MEHFCQQKRDPVLGAGLSRWMLESGEQSLIRRPRNLLYIGYEGEFLVGCDNAV